MSESTFANMFNYTLRKHFIVKIGNITGRKLGTLEFVTAVLLSHGTPASLLWWLLSSRVSTWASDSGFLSCVVQQGNICEAGQAVFLAAGVFGYNSGTPFINIPFLH